MHLRSRGLRERSGANMRRLIRSWVLAAVFAVQLASAAVVETPLGKIDGWEADSGAGRSYLAWTKVPYAQPPVGELRFQPPKPTEKWEGVLNATGEMPHCIQAGPDGQEDCLYLNIFRPKVFTRARNGEMFQMITHRASGTHDEVRDEVILDAIAEVPTSSTRRLGLQLGVPHSSVHAVLRRHSLHPYHLTKVSMQKKLPVLFYVHGGAFQGGNSASPKNIADNFMAEDVVLVLIHYRLNAFGFLSMGDAILPGNYGLKDQALALKWIKENIPFFGGDANSITVFGTSAGGASAHYLLKSPLTEGLLTRAWSDSGSINHVWALMKAEDVAANTLKLATHFGCPIAGSEEIVGCLRKVDARKLMRGVTDLTPRSMTLDDMFNPVIEPADAEGAFMIEDLALRPSNKPWITSTTNGEYLLHLIMIDALPDSYMENIKKNVSGYLYEWILRHTTDPQAISLGEYLTSGEYLYEKNIGGPYRKDLSRAFAKLHGDNGFVYPAVYNMMIHQGPKWMYRFEYVGLGSLYQNPKTGKPYPDGVAGHATEGSYYLNVTPNETPADRNITNRLVKYLTNFAKYGDPTPEGSPVHWKQFTTPVRNSMQTSAMETLRVTGEGDFLADNQFVEDLYGMYWTWNHTIAWS